MITEQAISPRVWTDDELLALPEEKLWKLVDGELIEMSPAGGQHGEICARLSALIFNHVRKLKLGTVYDSSTGFRLDKRNCFAADIAFVRKERVGKLLPDPDKFLNGAPDFAVEVKSSTNTHREIDRKIQLLIEHGTLLVWYILPKSRLVRVYRGSPDFESLDITATLTGEPVLPGFTLPVSEIFADPVFE